VEQPSNKGTKSEAVFYHEIREGKKKRLDRVSPHQGSPRQNQNPCGWAVNSDGMNLD